LLTLASADNPFEAFFDLVPTGAVLYAPVLDANGDVVDFSFVRLNLAAQRLLGLPAQPTTTFREQYPHSVPSGIFAQYRAAYLSGQVSTYEVPYEGDGIDTFFRLVAQRSGELLMVNFTDMADLPRTAVETALRESKACEQLAHAQAEQQRQRLYQILMQLPANINLLQGPDHVFELVNPAYQQLFPGRALLGRPMREALPELKGQGFFDVIENVYRSGTAYEMPEVETWADFNGTGRLELRYYSASFLPFVDAQGHVTGLLNVAFDVTTQVAVRQQVQTLNEELAATNEELRTSNEEYLNANTELSQAQQQLQQLNQGLGARVQQRTQELANVNEELQATNEELTAANQQLTRTNVDLDTFIYTASHDLKAPISNIESIALALRDTLPPEVQQDKLVAQLLALLNQTISRFQFTITQLTDISRLQLAHIGPAEPVVLARVVEDVRLDLAPAITEAQTQLTVEIAPELEVSFSPANLRSIIYNLLSNAIKYRAPDRPSRVRVRAEQTLTDVVLTVQDNGLGMSELQQRQLFGLFQRLHTHVEGSGVGLYISKRLIENAGGTISVQSQPAAGTTFTVTFPA
jgi:signal transduction histidine kinase